MMKNPRFIKLEKPPDVPTIFRNCQCPEYDNCLAAAAYMDLDLHCSACPLKDTKQETWITGLETTGCMAGG